MTNGTWNLVHVHGGLAGVNDDFNTGTIIWAFNESTSRLTVENNNTNTEAIYSGYESGEYDYSINNDIITIVVDGYDFNLVVRTLTGNDLVLDDDLAADGFLLELIR